MKIVIKTAVNQPAAKVFPKFDENLFLRLAPPFPKVKLLRFDGSQTGNRIVVELNFLLFKQIWESVITETRQTSEEMYFIDEGKFLPFFLKYWKHKHRVLFNGDSSIIIDDITYRTPFILFDWLIYPVMYLQFFYRKPVYKKVFS